MQIVFLQNILDTIVRLTTLEELVSAQTVEIAAIAQSDTEQNDRILVLEDDVDTWDDRIVALEAVDRDIQDRLVTLEETVLSNICIFIFAIHIQLCLFKRIHSGASPFLYHMDLFTWE